MTFLIAVLLTILYSTSSAFQISTPISEVRLTLATASSTNTRSVRACLIKTRSAHDPLRHRNPFRDTSSLQTKKEEENGSESDESDKSDDEGGGGGETEEPPPIRNRNVLDYISDSPLYTTFLLWAPIASNPRLRSRFADFLSEYLDLRIAVPVFAVGSVGAFAYVAYERRLVDIELARDTTEESLRVVREIRRAQMAGTGTIGVGGGGGGDAIGKEYETALENYGYTLREELKLRNSFVMLPLKIPNAPEGPDRAAAKQFLGMEIDE